MENYKCIVCGGEFETLLKLHNHIKKVENFCQKDYYEHFMPKYDLFDKSQIEYKNYTDYFSRRFTDKRTEFAYLMAFNFNPESQAILLEQIKDCSYKSYGRFPTYCEWRSSKNMRYDHMVKSKIFDRFLSLCKSLTFKFDYTSPLPEIIRKECIILTDTREQKPLFDGEKTSINVGDYTLSQKNYNGVHIDRKSTNDFIGTFTAGYERFKRECEKAKALDVSLVVLVESSFSECFNYKPLSHTRQKVTGENAFNGMRRITRAFPNVQFLFVKDRNEAKEYVSLILNNKDIVKKFDLQFRYETGEFK